MKRIDESTFWDNVEIGAEDACWNWLGVVTNTGHGIFCASSKHTLVNKYVYELTHGKINKDDYKYGYRILRTCSNNICCNPKHIYLESAEDRFWKLVDKTTTPDGCWNFIGYIDEGGYGTVRFDGKTQKAHRVSYIVENGPIPEGEGYHGTCVMHVVCDNPSCCRPDHLALGSNADNMADRNRKGRQDRPQGEKHNMHKLIESDINYIREHKEFKNCELAVMFDVHPDTISRIRLRKLWSHIK